MLQSYSLNSSHPVLPLQFPLVCSPPVGLYSCPANWFISTIFLESIYMIFVFLFLTDFVLYNRPGSTAFRLLPCPVYCKQFCNKQWGTCVFLNYGFLRVYAKQQNCWIIWQFLVVVVFFKNLHTVLHSGCINLHSHKQCKRVPFLHILSRIYSLQIFLMMAILISLR